MEAGTAAAPQYIRRESAPARAWSWLRQHGINIYAGLAIAYLLIPIAVIIFFSFNNPAGRYNFTWVGFTLDHWRNAFGISELNDALFTSLRLALFATLISTAIGTLMALALVRYQFFGRRSANFLIVIPMATPEIVMGAALLSFFLIINTPPLGFSTLLIAHVMFCISFVVVVVRSRLIGFDRSLEEAAQDLGANPFQTFFRVTLPLILPGIVAAALLAFALSIDDFVVTQYLSGDASTTTVSMLLYSSARGAPTPALNAIATVALLITLATLALAFVVYRRFAGGREATAVAALEV
jgi:spermidine/putrescine transport system permease protein